MFSSDLAMRARRTRGRSWTVPNSSNFRLMLNTVWFVTERPGYSFLNRRTVSREFRSHSVKRRTSVTFSETLSLPEQAMLNERHFAKFNTKGSLLKHNLNLSINFLKYLTLTSHSESKLNDELAAKLNRTGH